LIAESVSGGQRARCRHELSPGLRLPLLLVAALAGLRCVLLIVASLHVVVFPCTRRLSPTGPH
jgi:hypothetical protein